MNFYKLIIKSIFFYKKQNIALFLSILLSSAILSGALIIGDSVKISLKELVSKRLGNFHYALQTGDRFVTDTLAERLEDVMKIKNSSVLFLQGISINQSENKRVNKVNVIGVDKKFWEISEIKHINIHNNEVAISKYLAEKLNLKINDNFLLRIADSQIIPINTPFATEESSTVSIQLKVKYLLNNHQLANFNLLNDQKIPNNLFINKDFLSKELNLNNLANLILFPESKYTTKDYDKFLQQNRKLSDIGIKYRKLNQTNRFEWISNRIFIDNEISESLDNIRFSYNKYLTYLVNSINSNNFETPYSFITASEEVNFLDSNQIIINQWLADDLKVQNGDTLIIKYYYISSLKKIKEKETSFIIRNIIDIDNSLIDSLLMPNFPGITEAINCKEWQTSVPIDLKKIRNKDELYWKNYKGLPKAIISYKSGKKLWENSFGNSTNLRFNLSKFEKNTLEKKLLNNLNNNNLNMRFIPIRTQGYKAVENAVDFGGLFLSLSFFVIAGALILFLIILKLSIIARHKEFAIFKSIGFSNALIFKIKIFEISLIIFLGNFFGSFIGIYYTKLLLFGMNTIWNDIVRTDTISIHILPKTIIIAILTSFLVSVSIVLLTLRKQLKQYFFNIQTDLVKTKKYIFVNLLSYLTITLFVIISGYLYKTSSFENTTLFLINGSLILTFFTLFAFLHFSKIQRKRTTKMQTINNLIIKNLTLNKTRNISIILLLALGTFSIVVTSSNRRTFLMENMKKTYGTGGYEYWIELTKSIEYDLNSFEGKKQYNIQENELKNTQFYQFSRLEGDDASCLNLNQVSNPAILGINSKKFASEGAFSFAQILNGVENSWNLLNQNFGKNTYPAIADQTVITWGLMKSIGDTLHYTSEKGDTLHFILAAGLNSSVFQGHLLISDSIFKIHFPSSEGTKIMLINYDNQDLKKLENLLTEKFIDHGIEISNTQKRLTEFNSVTNTYLTIFMILGSLGVLIATFGLGLIILRSILERKYEIGLLLALGFTQKMIFKILIYENIILLFLGILIGSISGFIAIVPSVATQNLSASWLFVILSIGTIALNGFIWIYSVAKISLNQNIIKVLSEE